jgi:hypothetical protein
MGRATGHRQGCNGAVRAHQRARRLVRLGNTTRSKAKQSGWAARPPIRRSRSGRPHQMDGHPPSGDKIPLTGRLTTHDTRRPLGVTTVDVVNGVSGLPTSSNLSPPSTTVRVWRSGRVRRRAHVGQVVVRRPRSLRRAKCTGLDRATTRECSRRRWLRGGRGGGRRPGRLRLRRDGRHRRRRRHGDRGLRRRNAAGLNDRRRRRRCDLSGCGRDCGVDRGWCCTRRQRGERYRRRRGGLLRKGTDSAEQRHSTSCKNPPAAPQR